MFPLQYPELAPPLHLNQIGFNSLSQTNEERMSKFQHLVNRYEINREFATRLRGLEGYEITFIVDGKRKYCQFFCLPQNFLNTTNDQISIN